MIDNGTPTPLGVSAKNSSMGEMFEGIDPGKLLAWHRGESIEDANALEDMTTIGAEVADLMPAVARSLEYHVMMIESLDDAEGMHMDMCKIIAALMKRITPEVELLASLPDALNTRA